MLILQKCSAGLRSADDGTAFKNLDSEEAWQVKHIWWTEVVISMNHGQALHWLMTQGLEIVSLLLNHCCFEVSNL